LCTSKSSLLSLILPQSKNLPRTPAQQTQWVVVTVAGPGSVVEALDTAQTAETMDLLATKAAAAVEVATLDADELHQAIQDAGAVLQPHILRHLLHQATSTTTALMAVMTSS